MKIVPMQVTVLNPYSDTEPLDGDKILKHIERCGRTCYRSEHKISAHSAPNFVGNLVKRGHESVLEHHSVTMRFICDRGVSHQIVRHRLASYSQESQRYVNYIKEEFGSEVEYIEPRRFDPGSKLFEIWESACKTAEENYFSLINEGARAEDARRVLPNSCRTELVMTANLREWRHFCKVRCDRAAHPDTRYVACTALKQLQQAIPVIFDDIITTEDVAEFMQREGIV